MSATSHPGYFQIDYGVEIEAEIDQIQGEIAKWSEISKAFDPRWLALKLLEGE